MLDADGLRSVIHKMLETAAMLSVRIAAFISGGDADAGLDAPEGPDGARFA